MIEILSARPADLPDIPRGVTHLAFRSAVDGREDWALLWPPARGRTYLVCIHGYGSHADQLYTRADLRRDWWPEFQARGVGVLTPNIRDNSWMSPPAAADLRALLDYLRTEHRAERFVLFGGSMGGTSVLVYAVLHPEDMVGVGSLCPATDIAARHEWCKRYSCEALPAGISAAIAEAYGGTPAEIPEVYDRHSCLAHADRLTMPVYLAHGDADEIIPISESRALAALLPARTLKYREIRGGGHDSPLALDVIREGLDWILPPEYGNRSRLDGGCT